MRRRKMSRRKSNQVWKSSAGKVHKKNRPRNTRLGTRL